MYLSERNIIFITTVVFILFIDETANLLTIIAHGSHPLLYTKCTFICTLEVVLKKYVLL